jgi:drug/metabolite transporter (DMT)-like permease
MQQRPRFRGRVLFEPLAAALLWGGVFTAAKFGLRDFPALSFIAVRVLLAAAILLLLSIRWSTLRVSRDVWQPLIQPSLAQASFQLLLFEAINQTSASISAILLATAPLMTAGWLAVTARERMGPRQWVGICLGIVGVAFVVRADGTDLAGASLVGNLLALGSAVAWAWYGLTIGPLARAVGPVGATAATLVIASLILTPLGARELIALDWSSVTLAGWVGVLYGATLGLVLATLLWVRSIQRWGTQPTMNYGYVEPVAAVVIAAILLGEALHPLQGVGALLALTGVYLSTPQDGA